MSEQCPAWYTRTTAPTRCGYERGHAGSHWAGDNYSEWSWRNDAEPAQTRPTSPAAPDLTVLGYLPPLNPTDTVVITLPCNPTAMSVSVVQHQAERALGCRVLVMAEGMKISEPIPAPRCDGCKWWKPLRLGERGRCTLADYASFRVTPLLVTAAGSHPAGLYVKPGHHCAAHEPIDMGA